MFFLLFHRIWSQVVHEDTLYTNISLVYSSNNTYIFSACTFIECQSKEAGGAVRIWNSQASAILKKLVFVNCSTSFEGAFGSYNRLGVSGGALALSTYTTNISKSCFDSCVGSSMGTSAYYTASESTDHSEIAYIRSQTNSGQVCFNIDDAHQYCSFVNSSFNSMSSGWSVSGHYGSGCDSGVFKYFNIFQNAGSVISNAGQSDITYESAFFNIVHNSATNSILGPSKVISIYRSCIFVGNIGALITFINPSFTSTFIDCESTTESTHSRVTYVNWLFDQGIKATHVFAHNPYCYSETSIFTDTSHIYNIHAQILLSLALLSY